MVWKGYDFYLRLGCYIGSVVYYVDGNIVDDGNEGFMVYRLIEGM